MTVRRIRISLFKVLKNMKITTVLVTFLLIQREPMRNGTYKKRHLTGVLFTVLEH